MSLSTIASTVAVTRWLSQSVSVTSVLVLFLISFCPMVGTLFSMLTLYSIGYIWKFASFSINNSNFQIFSKKDFLHFNSF